MRALPLSGKPDKKENEYEAFLLMDCTRRVSASERGTSNDRTIESSDSLISLVGVQIYLVVVTISLVRRLLCVIYYF